jgi:hypothetical protein
MATVNPSIVTAFNSGTQNFYSVDLTQLTHNANAIANISKANPAVVTVPTVATVISATGTIGSVVGTLTSGVTVFSSISGTSVTAAATYTGVSQSATSGSGSGAVFTIVKAGAGTAYSGAVTITVTSVGSGYAVGDTITIPGASLGGTTPTNNMTMTVGSGIIVGPWTATISGMTKTTGLVSGQIITATAGTGTFAAGGEVSVSSVVGNQSIVLYKVGGTIPTAGTVTNISVPAVSSLPPGLVDSTQIQITGVEDATLTFTESTPTGTYFRASGCSVSGTTLTIGTLITGTISTNQVLTGVNSLLDGLHIVANISGSGSGSTWTLSSTPGTLITQVVTGLLPSFVVGETITQATSNATAVITGVDYNGASSTLNINTVSGTFNTTDFVTGGTSSAGMTPTAAVGMTELATAGANNTNNYYIDVVDGTSFRLYRNAALSTAVNSSAFTTAVANTGQYTTFTGATTSNLGSQIAMVFDNTETNVGTDISLDVATGEFTLEPNIVYQILVEAQALPNAASQGGYLALYDKTAGSLVSDQITPIGGTLISTVLVPAVANVYQIYCIAPDGGVWQAPAGIQNASITITAASGFEQ